MSDPSYNAKSNDLDTAVVNELHQLCSLLYDQAISADELTRLNELLDSRPSARRFYLRCVALHSTLLISTGKQQRIEAEELCSRVAELAQADEAILNELQGDLFACKADALKETSRRPSLWVWGTAVSLLIASTATVWAVRRSNDQAATATKLARETKSPRVSQAADKPNFVARLSFISPNIRWQKPNETLKQGGGLAAGKLLELKAGEVELVYRTGTKLLLFGPAEFLVDEAGGELRRGGLVASVTEEGYGFTIETPNGRIVDLGTEFGVVVDDFGVSEVSVFEGKVEAFPLGRSRNGEKFELTNGHGLQWNQDKLISLDADLRRFAAAVLDRSEANDNSDGRSRIADRFYAATLDKAKWKYLGDVRATTSGLRLLGDAAHKNQPYLISAEQFDPAHGPITVTCDFQFADVGTSDAPTLSILTRSDDQRGTAPMPWTDTLASCVRCSFGSDADPGQGMLQAGVKLEADREMASISWKGFVRPAADIPYRVVMRDDGVNVSFTVSLRDDPSTAKTVTCRSLFRGKANYVALEGSAVGETQIDRVEIAQDRTAKSLSSYADFASLMLDGSAQSAIEGEQLAALAPDDSVLLVADDFSSGRLDADKWTTLGEVGVRDGAVQLGLPNPEAHIDTWKARPYLLTSERLKPGASKLTITGRIRFADNFLAGYGASFAVMTRADDRRGEGPGWENSVLQRGVRANFWPAAWDLKHSLEIHEKPAANTITLLATQGVQVDPTARSYLFRVVDDGQSVTLTVVDPLRSELTKTITSSTTSKLDEGFVGFESCWGSPVTLDDVRVYATGQSVHNSSAATTNE